MYVHVCVTEETRWGNLYPNLRNVTKNKMHILLWKLKEYFHKLIIIWRDITDIFSLHMASHGRLTVTKILYIQEKDCPHTDPTFHSNLIAQY